jgi:hypothetical protein
MATENQPSQVKIQVKYEDLTARYASQVLVNTGQEEVFLDFSSGMLPDPSGGSVMPVHTRIVMTAGGVRRFHQVLSQLVSKLEEKKAVAPTS